MVTPAPAGTIVISNPTAEEIASEKKMALLAYVSKIKREEDQRSANEYFSKLVNKMITDSDENF